MKQMNQQMQIAFTVQTDKEMKPIEFTFEHSEHSYQRAQQRGISGLQLETALKYGETMLKQGYIFYILGKNNIPEKLRKEKDKLVNTIVLVSGKTIITCYRNTRPFKHIRKKSKKLFRNVNYAA